MKKLILIGLSVFLFIPCCKTPTVPIETARVKVNFKESTIYVYWKAWKNRYYSDFTVVVSEYGGVGGRIITCEIELYDDDGVFIREATFLGKPFFAYGGCEILCSIEIGSKVDEIRAIVWGVDNYDFFFEAQTSIWYR